MYEILHCIKEVYDLFGDVGEDEQQVDWTRQLIAQLKKW